MLRYDVLSHPSGELVDRYLRFAEPAPGLTTNRADRHRYMLWGFVNVQAASVLIRRLRVRSRVDVCHANGHRRIKKGTR